MKVFLTLRMGILSLFLLAKPCVATAFETGIHGLVWKSGPVQVLRDLRSGTFHIELNGYYLRENWNLYLGNYPVPLAEDRSFSLRIPVNFNVIKIDFEARGPREKMEVETDTVMVYLNGFFPPREKKIKKISWVKRHLRDLSMNIGIGPSMVSYEQTDLPSVRATNLTPRLDFIYIFDDSAWSWEWTTYASFLSSTSSPLATGGFRIFLTDLRVGHEWPIVKGAIAFYLFGGVYYTTTFGNENIGYKGVLGPEIFPALRIVFQNGSQLNLHVRYSPIMNGFFPMSLGNAYFTGGATFFFAPISQGSLSGMPIGVGIEASRLKLNLALGESVTTSYLATLNLLL